MGVVTKEQKKRKTEDWYFEWMLLIKQIINFSFQWSVFFINVSTSQIKYILNNLTKNHQKNISKKKSNQ